MWRESIAQPFLPRYIASMSTGHRQLWKELNPPDPAGINFIRPLRSPPMGRLTRTTTVVFFPTCTWSTA